LDWIIIHSASNTQFRFDKKQFRFHKPESQILELFASDKNE